MLVLNVGGGAGRDLPEIYSGWEQELLDIDPGVNPDIVCDARDMLRLERRYDSVYSSHCLEHFYIHEIPAVLAGFRHVLKPSGFVYSLVPDMTAVFRALQDRDIGDVWYVSNAGPITFHDVIYGFGKQVEIGNLYYCHKTGFTEKSMAKAFGDAGFPAVLTSVDGANLHVFAFPGIPSEDRLKSLGVA